MVASAIRNGLEGVFDTMRSVIVTGGFGVLGRAVAQAFRDNGETRREFLTMIGRSTL